MTAAAAVGSLLLAGCQTLVREPTQALRIEAVDSLDRPVRGLACRVGDLPGTVTLPAIGVVVHRSWSSLEIDCRRGALHATATVVPRRDGLEQALVPFGSVAVLVDHLSGKLYDYPTVLRLHLGQHVTLEHGGESRIAKSEPLPGATTVAAAEPPPKPARVARAGPKAVVAASAPATW